MSDDLVNEARVHYEDYAFVQALADETERLREELDTAREASEIHAMDLRQRDAAIASWADSARKHKAENERLREELAIANEGLTAAYMSGRYDEKELAKIKAQQAQGPVESAVSGKCSCGEVLIPDPRYTVETDSVIHRYTQPCYHKAQQAQEPIARVAGYYGGRAGIEYLNHRLVLPVGTALYLSPQKAQAQEPVAEVDMNAPGLINWFSVPKSGTKLYTTPQSAEVDQLNAALALAREQLQMIVNANPRKWEELSEPESEFERWAKSRANQVLAAIDGAKLLDGLVLCDAEPVYRETASRFYGPSEDHPPEAIPLYRRKS